MWTIAKAGIFIPAIRTISLPITELVRSYAEGRALTQHGGAVTPWSWGRVGCGVVEEGRLEKKFNSHMIIHFNQLKVIN